MQALLSELAKVANARFEGDGDCVIGAVNTLLEAEPGQITFLTNKRYRAELAKTKASAVILDESFVVDCPVKNKIICDNPYLAYALIASHLCGQQGLADTEVHPSATIDASAEIAESADIGANVVIGKNVVISKDVRIGPGCVIGDDCVIGAASLLAANVTFYAGVKVGEKCLVHSGAVLGGDGFGFANNKGEWVKIPQTGGVRVGNNVEIGVNTAIDRGAIHDTIIADGVKLDNLIQIAHNVSIGKNTAIAGGTAIAGSTSIGERCTIGGCSGIIGHLDIADNVHISAMTIVTKSLTRPDHYTGNVPAMPHVIWARNMVRLKQLDKLSKRLSKLENNNE